jgi:hypothetical protein
MGVKQPLDVPVAMIVYKRLDKTKQSFAAVRSVAPKKLYIIADGPKDAEDKKQVQAVREFIDSHIDWDCKVYRDYAPVNMGARYRMPSGMAWVFKKEDRAIFIEDDIKASPNFFYFCRDMLEHYKNDKRVAMISGCNLYPGDESFGKDDISFSSFALTWGWATWRRAWQDYDVNIRNWPQLKRKNVLRKVMSADTRRFFTVVFDDLQYHWYKIWDYQWYLMMWSNDRLGIVPKYNLVNNIGMGDEAGEHPGDTQDKVDHISNVPMKVLNLPIEYPSWIKRNKAYDKMFEKKFYTEKIGIFKRIKYAIRAAHYEKVYSVIKQMEADDEYFNKKLQDKYKLSPQEVALNNGDKYRLITPKEMIKSANKYKAYKKKQDRLEKKQQEKKQ